MKLTAWRRKQGMTQAELADHLGCSQSYVSQMERAVEPIIPGPAIMIALFEMSCGDVQPNDFYELPRLSTDREAA